MQFFPASMYGGAQSFRAGGAFEMMENRSGQDFHDLFSAHLNQPDTAVVTPQTSQAEPPASHEQVFADDHVPAEDGRDTDYRESSPIEEESVSASPDPADHEGGRVEESAGGSAKAAAQEPQASGSGQPDSVSAAESAALDKENGMRDAENADDSTAVAVQELLDSLAEEVRARGADNDDSVISEKIAALHELLRQFQKSDPSNRSELAVTLGEQMRGLKAELAAAGKGGDGTENLGRKTEKVSSPVMQKIDALLVRLEAHRTAGHEGVSPDKSLAKSLGKADASVASKVGVVGGEQGGQSRAAKSRTLAAEAAKGASGEALERKQGDDPKSEIPVALKDGKGPEIGTRPVRSEKQSSDVQGQPGTRVAASEGSAGKSPTVLDATEEALAESVATDAERKHSAAKDQDGAARNGSVVTRGGLPAAADRAVAARESSGQTVAQDAASLAREGEAASAGSAAAADSKGEKKQPDARQGFFGTQDGEKSSSSASRAAQVDGNTKTAPESQPLTPASAQTSQSQFQQRMEAPVSARNTEVYQQVENGAFRNLGQGVKQLVIRLDPADLGQVSVILQVRGKEVQAVLRSSNQETSLALNEQLGQLRTQLEAQGLKVGKLEVQTQLADSQSQSQWQGSENHNRYQENQELASSAKRWRTLERVAGGMVRDVQNSGHREKLSQSGLDIFA
ncbi:MAG: flagellar hook-length control protein FliK [Proteobacteria bacterium]|nr:flagellar hook-length control protein FliK [Pseudomonadota bacterium]